MDRVGVVSGPVLNPGSYITCITAITTNIARPAMLMMSPEVIGIGCFLPAEYMSNVLLITLKPSKQEIRRPECDDDHTHRTEC